MTVRYRTAPLPGYPDRTQPTRKHDGPPYCFLFGLASDGVYTALSVTSQAVSSYPTIPPSPGDFFQGFPTRFHGKSVGKPWKKSPAVSFLLHWSWSHLHRTLSGILPCEARTFLTVSGATVCAALRYSNTILKLCKSVKF